MDLASLGCEYPANRVQIQRIRHNDVQRLRGNRHNAAAPQDGRRPLHRFRQRMVLIDLNKVGRQRIRLASWVGSVRQSGTFARTGVGASGTWLVYRRRLKWTNDLSAMIDM